MGEFCRAFKEQQQQEKKTKIKTHQHGARQ